MSQEELEKDMTMKKHRHSMIQPIQICIIKGRSRENQLVQSDINCIYSKSFASMTVKSLSYQRVYIQVSFLLIVGWQYYFWHMCHNSNILKLPTMHKTLSLVPRLARPTAAKSLLLRNACSIAITAQDVEHSQYHLKGPLNMEASHLTELVVGSNLQSIKKITHELDSLRTRLSSHQGDSTWDQYVSLFGELTNTVSQCELRNQWVASIISWYNLTPLYPALLEQLLKAADKQNLKLLAELLPKMKEQAATITEEQLKDFFKRLTFQLNVASLKSIVENLPETLTLSRRYFFSNYLTRNLEKLLKQTSVSDMQAVKEILWLFRASVKSMVDDEFCVGKFERFLMLGNKLDRDSVEQLMEIYTAKGRINPHIYQYHIRPVLMQEVQSMDLSRLLHIFQFLVCSEVKDESVYSLVIHQITHKFQKDADSGTLKRLHMYGHYLIIKESENQLPEDIFQVLEKHFKTNCSSQSLGRLVLKTMAKRSRAGWLNSKKFISDSLDHNYSIKWIDDYHKQEFFKEYGRCFAPLSIKDIAIYSDVQISGITMEYCINHPKTDTLINFHPTSLNQMMSSGRCLRPIQIQEEILQYYGVQTQRYRTEIFRSMKRLTPGEDLMVKKVTNYL